MPLPIGNTWQNEASRSADGVRYIPHTEAEIEQMLDVIGLPNIEALFSYVPEKYRLNRPLQIPEAASEQEVLAELTALAQRNVNTSTHDWFLTVSRSADSAIAAMGFLPCYGRAHAETCALYSGRHLRGDRVSPLDPIFPGYRDRRWRRCGPCLRFTPRRDHSRDPGWVDDPRRPAPVIHACH